MNDFFAPLPPWQFAPLRPRAYNLIVADPPWKYENYSERGEGKGASAHYKCYPPEEIAWMFPVGDLADFNCLLLCWATAPLIDRQIACVQAWGFEFKSLLIWRKVFGSGAPAIGTGYRVRSMAEPVIVATMGRPKHKPLPGLFAGVRRENSRKPEEFYAIVDRACPQLRRRADVFARQLRLGYDGFGDEIDKFSLIADGGDDDQESTE